MLKVGLFIYVCFCLFHYAYMEFLTKTLAALRGSKISRRSPFWNLLLNSKEKICTIQMML